MLVNFFVSCFFTDAKNVASREHELFKVQLHVALLQTWPEAESCTVLVSGLGNNMSKDTAILFFQEEKNSGGGPIEEFFNDEDNGTVFITYHDRESMLYFKIYDCYTYIQLYFTR